MHLYYPYSTTEWEKTKILVTFIDNQLGNGVRLIYESSISQLQ